LVFHSADSSDDRLPPFLTRDPVDEVGRRVATWLQWLLGTCQSGASLCSPVSAPISTRSCNLLLIFFKAIRPSRETTDSLLPSQSVLMRESQTSRSCGVTKRKSTVSKSPPSGSTFETRRTSTAPSAKLKSLPRIS